MGSRPLLYPVAIVNAGALKRTAEALGSLLALPFRVYFAALTAAMGRAEAFRATSETLAPIPSPLGLVVRAAFYRSVLPRVGDNVTFGYGTILTHPTIELDDDVYLGRYCLLGNVRIGKGVMVADFARVVTGIHGTAEGLSMREQETTYLTITLADESWIANGAIILADVGRGAVVGAGSVVTKPVADGDVVVGNPARVLRSRGSAADAA